MPSSLQKRVRDKLAKQNIDEIVIDNFMVALMNSSPKNMRLAYSAAMSAETEDEILTIYRSLIATDGEDLSDINMKYSKRAFGVKTEVSVSTNILEQFPIVKSATCSTCRVKGTVVSLGTFQIRSADEGETSFFACKKCGKRWSH